MTGGAVLAGGLIAAWAVATLLFEPARLNVAAPGLQAGAAAGSAAIRLSCAVVLVLFVAEGVGRRRLHWTAGGLVVLGLGSVVLGFLMPVSGVDLDLDRSLYLSVILLALADGLFAIGLVPATPPPFTLRSGLAIAGTLSGAGLGVLLAGDRLPPLVEAGRRPGAGVTLSLADLTPWYWLVIALPVVLANVAAAGAVARYVPSERMGGWLVLAMVVFAGAHLHHLLWPAVYQSVLTSANVLRSASAAILAIGGLVELRRVAAERASLLEAEQAYSARLAELAALKADFNAIVAHELGAPVAAISRLADALATGELDAERQAVLLGTFRAEVALLEKLAADVTAAARDEREDFDVRPQPTSVAALLAEAAAVAKALPGNHPLTVEAPREVQVYADPVRISQVLRNLLCNAAKYSPPGAPITLCARVGPKRVRIEVVDRGVGIHPADLDRIFRKFARGRNTDGQRVPGVGLGLYLSRRIVRMHGGELTVSSWPGVGSTFGFELEAVR